MNLFELAAEITLDTDGYDKGISAAKKTASAAGKAIAVAFTAAATAVGAITKSAVNAYAEFEQLQGGVETLFGDSADTIFKYAQNAYETSQLSANEYMQQATTFAASLLQSLGGDTEEAARYADLAITDMSDNAAKMGTSIESIQNAYQGFSKQNYTMLDNLKLGYGGTKQEMERLIADANKLRRAQGINNDLTIDSYADVVEAIHTIQDEMGITGTTAEEASTTIQGSFAMAKSAWSNLLVGLANGKTTYAELQTLTKNFANAAITAFRNVAPAIKAVFSNLPTVIAELIPELARMITDILPDLIEAAGNLIVGLAEALPDIIETLIEQLPTIFKSLATALDTIVTGILEKIDEMLGGVGLPEAWQELKDEFSNLITDVKNKVKPAFDRVVKAIKPFVTKLIDTAGGAKNVAKAVMKMITYFVAAKAAITAAKLATTLFSGALNTLSGTWIVAAVAGLIYLITHFKEVDDWCRNTVTDLDDWLKKQGVDIGGWLWDSMLSVLRLLVQWGDLLEPIYTALGIEQYTWGSAIEEKFGKGFVDGLREGADRNTLLKAMADGYTNKIEGESDKSGKRAGNKAGKGMLQSLADALNKGKESAKNSGKFLIDKLNEGIDSKKSSLNTKLSKTIKDALKKARDDLNKGIGNLKPSQGTKSIPLTQGLSSISSATTISGVTINVNGTSGNGTMIAQEISRELQRMTERRKSVWA